MIVIDMRRGLIERNAANCTSILLTLSKSEFVFECHLEVLVEMPNSTVYSPTGSALTEQAVGREFVRRETVNGQPIPASLALLTPQ